MIYDEAFDEATLKYSKFEVNVMLTPSNVSYIESVNLQFTCANRRPEGDQELEVARVIAV